MYNAYVLFRSGRGPYAALAASPYTSNHWNGGNPIAVDIGVTMPDGSNRATNATENAVLISLMTRFGFQHTGATFRVYEQWHYEYHGGATDIAPVGIKLDSVATTTSASTGAKTPVTPTTTIPEGITEDMFAIVLNSASGAPHANSLPKGARFILDTREKTLTRIDSNPTVSAAQLQTLKDEYNTYVAFQPGKNALAWTGDVPWRYIAGGYTRKGW